MLFNYNRLLVWLCMLIVYVMPLECPSIGVLCVVLVWFVRVTLCVVLVWFVRVTFR